VPGIEGAQLDRGRLWAAYSRRDARFDGQFVAAVRTTSIYCRPSCSCRRPRPEHVEYFLAAEHAEQAGHRPCKRCRPELPGGVAEAERRFVERALEVMRARLDEPLSIGDLAAALAASASSFAHRFRAADGRTPMHALADLRVERAKMLLATARGTVLDVAMSAGFQSLSAFARAFRRRTGLAPSFWRARYARGGRSWALALGDRTAALGHQASVVSRVRLTVAARCTPFASLPLLRELERTAARHARPLIRGAQKPTRGCPGLPPGRLPAVGIGTGSVP
jgi:methylphosphotriester-DNA--protein-cysteine methyltransferase